MKRLIFAVRQASIHATLPSQSTCLIVDKSYGLLVEASTIAVIPSNQGGIVSGIVKSP